MNNLNRLTITKVYNRLHFMIFLRTQLTNDYSLSAASVAHTQLPIVIKDLAIPNKLIDFYLQGHVEYTYGPEPMSEDELFDLLEREEEQKNYAKANAWYNSLSDKKKQMIDVLIEMGVAHA